MKKFIIKLSIFLCFLFCIDRLTGFAFSYMVDHTKGGYIGHHKYINDKCDKQLVVYGSSRALHHYNTRMLSDSLGFACYNCGQDGNGILLNYGHWLMMKERYYPQTLIYDIEPNLDFLVYDDNHRYLGYLKAYYNRTGIQDIFRDIDKTEILKMQSQLYRYNFKPLDIITDFIKPFNKVDEFGYVPHLDSLDRTKIKSDHPVRDIDPLKIEYLKKFIESKGESNLIFVVSPRWYGRDDKELNPVREICEEYKIPFFDYSNDKRFVHNDLYFKDGEHMNAQGADVFTNDLLHIIRDNQ